MAYTAVQWKIPGEVLDIFMVSLVSQFMPVLQNSSVSGLSLQLGSNLLVISFHHLPAWIFCDGIYHLFTHNYSNMK